MNRESFQILIFAADDHLTQDCSSRIRAHFAKLPLQIDTETSARRTISEFRQKLHDLVILSAGSALEELPSLILQLQSVSGSARTLVLATESPKAQNIDFVQAPILKWETLLDLVTDCVPEHLAARYRLPKLKTPTRLALETYAERYRQTAVDPQNSITLTLAPRLLMLGQAGSNSQTLARSMAGSHPTSTQEQGNAAPSLRFSMSSAQRRQALLLESGAWIALVLAAGALHWFADPEAPSTLLSLKNIVSALAVAATLGFFGSRTLDRVHFSQDDREN